MQLLTSKPALYVCNVDEAHAATGNAYSKSVFEHFGGEGVEDVVISAQIEAELAQLDEEERKLYLAELGLEEPGLNKLIAAGYRLLGLITYFTAGPKEVRAWTITKGTAAPGAAGVIHTDFEKGFIRAETIAYRDFVTLGGETGAKRGRQNAPRRQGVHRARRRYHALPLRELTALTPCPSPARGEGKVPDPKRRAQFGFLLPLWEKDRMRGKPHAVRVRYGRKPFSRTRHYATLRCIRAPYPAEKPNASLAGSCGGASSG